MVYVEITLPGILRTPSWTFVTPINSCPGIALNAENTQGLE